MNLGIFLPEISPDRGGAFTFVETVIAGLLEARSGDSIVLFHYGPSHDVGFNVEMCSLATGSAGRFVKKVWLGEVTARLQAPLAFVSRVIDKQLPYPAGSPLDRAARARGIDLMWFPTPMYERVEMPYIITVWDLEHRAHPYFPELGAQGEWAQRDKYYTEALGRATYVVTGTAVGRDEIVRFYNVDAERIRIMPHPTPSFALEATDEAKLDLPRPFVFYPAQFWAHKNHIGLLNALAELRERGTVVHAALVGSDKGNLEHVRSRAQALGIASQVHFLGFVERPQLIALYRQASALVYTSLCGPENLPPLEAMALGCPVIASDIPGAREQLGDAALLVDTLDTKALADAITRVMSSDDARNALVAKGKARAARYTQREFGRDMRALVDDFRRRRELWRT